MTDPTRNADDVRLPAEEDPFAQVSAPASAASEAPPIVASAADPPAARPRQTLSEFLGYVQFTKIRNAILNHPDPLVDQGRLPRPQATEGLAQQRAQSGISPDALRLLLAERRAMPQLSDRLSQARIDSAPRLPPATQPSAQ